MPHPTLHITRGVLASTLAEARTAHNTFTDDGPQPGATSRALGDVSHNVFTPAEGEDGALGAPVGEMLFIDYWADTHGMETFFAHPEVAAASDRLFVSREEAEWAVAPDGFGFCAPAPHALPPRFLAMTRAAIGSAEEDCAAVAKLISARIPAARLRGRISHALFIRQADIAGLRPAANAHRAHGKAPGTADAPVEILALDWWSSLNGLIEHYNETAANYALQDVLAGPRETTMWQQQSDFSEW
jgi:hypothetical protein